MSDHEFERQVRQKLNDLKLAPTPRAWENIEDALRQRRRRMPFLWLSLLLLGLAAGGYFILFAPATENNKEQGLSYSSKNIHGEDAPSAGNNSGKNKPAPDLFVEKKSIHNSVVKTEKEAKPASMRNRTSKGDKWSGQKENTGGEIISGRVNELTATEQSGVDQHENNNRNEEIVAKETQSKTDSTAHDLQALSTQLKPDSAIKSVTPAVRAVAEKKKKSKWSYALHLQAGVSAGNDGAFFKLGKTRVEDVAFSAPLAGTTANFAPVFSPSEISPGPMFSAGALVKRELSGRFAISAGIDYTQLSTKMKPANRTGVNNLAGSPNNGYLFLQSFYRPTVPEVENHRNTYHYIQIPISLHTRLNNSTKLPVYWDAGIIVAKLISSTSLHFNSNTGTYYRNDHLLNQMQAGVSTGISVALFNKTSRPLWIGPSVQSNFSSILKKDIPDAKHFVTAGLDMKWFLKK